MIKLSERVRGLAPSATMAAAQRAREMRAKGINVISFTVGEPDFDTPNHIKEAAKEAMARGETKYTAASGTDALKDAIITRLARDCDLTYERSQIMATAGGKQGIYNAMAALLDPGDEVIVVSPAWVSYFDIIKFQNGVPVSVVTRFEDDFDVQPEAIKEAVTDRTRAILINSPNNPTGAVMAPDTIKAIAEIAVENDIIVISDEMYDALVYDNFPVVSIATFGPEIKERTLIINGLSKAYAMTGWRLGYAAGPQELVSAMGKIQGQQTVNPCTLAMGAGVVALTDDQECVRTMAQEFDRRRKRIVALLNEMPGIECRTPLGAFYAFPKVSALFGKSAGKWNLETADDVTDYLLDEAHIAGVTGTAFGPGGEEFLRLSYATSMEQIEEGMAAMKEAVAKLS